MQCDHADELAIAFERQHPRELCCARLSARQMTAQELFRIGDRVVRSPDEIARHQWVVRIRVEDRLRVRHSWRAQAESWSFYLRWEVHCALSSSGRKLQV